MKTKEQSVADNLFISYDYPHSLMMHIVTIQRELNLTSVNLFYEESFLQEFEKRYASFSNEICELDLALKKKIIDDFIKNSQTEEWKKRVFLTLSLTHLLKDLREYEAVELLESLMFLFHWEMEFEIQRTWMVLDKDKAWFHCPTKVENLYKDSFDLQAKKYIEKQKSAKKQFTQGKIFRAKRPDLEMPIETDSSDISSSNILTVESDASETESKKQFSFLSQTKNIIEDSSDQSTVPFIYWENTRIQELSDEKYKQEIQQIQIKHENLMNLSLRKEIKAARRGDNIAQMHLADFYAEDGTKHTDYAEAVRWYSYASKKGNMRAKYKMGCIFDNEKIEGVRSKEFGIQCFIELAEEDYPTAQYILGMKYYLGDGIEKDIGKAISWLKKAAFQGIVEAQKQLGNIYLDLNLVEAKKWYYKASAAGDFEAMQRLKRL